MAVLKIKNMVCDRCIMSVREVLEHLGYEVNSVVLGRAELKDDVVDEELDRINEKLRTKGFELIREDSEALIEEIKATLIDYLKEVEENQNPPKLSAFLADKMHHNYSYLSSRFSKEENSTIEQHFINLKIERVKELLSYDELTLSEIAWKLNYSSVQYLSNQFKKVTGETVSSFRENMDARDRQSLDALN